MTPCPAPDCKRATRPGWALCDDHARQLLNGHVTRRPRVVVRRMGVRPLAEISESELRLLDGNR